MTEKCEKSYIILKNSSVCDIMILKWSVCMPCVAEAYFYDHFTVRENAYHFNILFFRIDLGK